MESPVKANVASFYDEAKRLHVQVDWLGSNWHRVIFTKHHPDGATEILHAIEAKTLADAICAVYTYSAIEHGGNPTIQI